MSDTVRDSTGSALLDRAGAVMARSSFISRVATERRDPRSRIVPIAALIGAMLVAATAAAIGVVALGAHWQARQQPSLADLTLQAQWQAMATQHAVARDPRATGAVADSVPAACRSGAFVEASGILGSVAQIADQLPATTTERTRAELDTVLFTALKQARAEVHCVAGGLTHGYDRAYAQTVERATQLARQRGLHADIVALGQETAAVLRGNRVIAAR
jgi:hypothetical protein